MRRSLVLTIASLAALAGSASNGGKVSPAAPRVVVGVQAAALAEATPAALPALPAAGAPAAVAAQPAAGAPATVAVLPPVAHTSDAGLRLVVVDNGATAAAAPARALMLEVLGSLSTAERARLEHTVVRLDLIPVDRHLTDLPDFAFLRGGTTFDGRPYSLLRAVGPSVSGAVVTYSVGAEQVVAGGVSAYGPGFAVSHESGHVVRHLALTHAEDAALRDLYAQRLRSPSPWLTNYASSNDDEYFADSTAAWFGHPWSSASSSRFSRAWLRANDPGMAALLQQVYGLS